MESFGEVPWHLYLKLYLKLQCIDIFHIDLSLTTWLKYKVNNILQDILDVYGL